MSEKRVAYLCSEYPGISHTFIFREILTLRELGYEVITSSIRKPQYLTKMTKQERIEYENTFFILGSSLFNVLLAHLYILFRSPFKYISMLQFTIKHIQGKQGGMLKGLAYFGESGVLVKWLIDKQTNHLHVHFGNPAATVAMIASIYGKMTYSMSIHGPDLFYNVDYNLLEEKIRRATIVRCISYYCRSQLMRLVPYYMWKKFTIVRCGIDPEVFTPEKKIGNTITEILCLGRLVPAKGQHILLEAAKNLCERDVPFHLTYVGDGSDRESLESSVSNEKLEKYITFTGAVGQDKVQQYYNAADIFVLASFAEGVPVVLMEAMAKEIPSISTNITGIPELIEDGVDGILVPASDSDKLTEKLIMLIENKELREIIGCNGRKKVLEKYNLKNNCKDLVKIF